MLRVALGALLLAPFALHCIPGVAKKKNDFTEMLKEMSNDTFEDFLNKQKNLYGDPCSNPSLAQSNVQRADPLIAVETSFGWLVNDGAGNTLLYEKKESQNILSSEEMQEVHKHRRLKKPIMCLFPLNDKEIIYVHANKKKILIFSGRKGFIVDKNNNNITRLVPSDLSL